MLDGEQIFFNERDFEETIMMFGVESENTICSYPFRAGHIVCCRGNFQSVNKRTVWIEVGSQDSWFTVSRRISERFNGLDKVFERPNRQL